MPIILYSYINMIIPTRPLLFPFWGMVSHPHHTEGLKSAEEIWSLLDAEKKGYVEREALRMAGCTWPDHGRIMG